MEDTTPFTAELILWHVAFHLEQYFLLAMIFIESHSVYGGFTTVAHVQRSCVVQDSHGRDICREVS